LTLQGRGVAVTALAFAPDNRNLVAGCEDGTVTIWDVPTRQKRVTLAAHDGAVLSLALSADATTLVTGGHGRKDSNGTVPGEIKIWNVDNAKVRATVSTGGGSATDLAISPDGKTLAATVSDQAGAVGLWDVESAKPKSGPKGLTGEVRTVAFSPNGKVLALGIDNGPGASGTTLLYDLATSKQRLSLNGAAGGVSSIAFSPDGQFLATAGEDGLVRLWSIADAGTAVEPRPDETVELKEPADGAALPNRRGGRLTWDFTWSPVERAEAYEIVVQHVGSANPAVSERVGSTSYRYDKVGAVSPENAEGWVWRVRAIRDGKPLPWSELRTFRVAPAGDASN
ncbi:MAG: WD40 repeat domain-containing protein, partial [Planctomycetaceae bacterium]